ncbi:MAG: glucose 1-dehydrogenase [Dehalococcoidia bacterium]|nr:glucose 1-dehydrogenase [Dehalococcoidia bacterium]
MRLKDKVAIITGAGRGIGRAYALRFAEEGAKVVVAELVLENAQKVVQEIEARGGIALAVQTDVADEVSTREMAERTAATFKKIDILVNNAAIYYGIGMRHWDSWTKEEWERMFAVNVIGGWLCVRAVAAHMIAQHKGKIINVSSTTFNTGVPNFLPYTCTKGAVVAMTRSLARALGHYGINVNCIVPGLTLSEASLEMSGVTRQGIEMAARIKALGRAEMPEDLVGAVVFLASDDSDFITGQSIVVDGGDYMQ